MLLKSLPPYLCYDIYFKDHLCSTVWGVVSEVQRGGRKGPVFQFECYQKSFNVAELALKSGRKKSVYLISKSGKPLSATLEDSAGGKVEATTQGNRLTYGGENRSLDVPLDFIIQSNLFPLIAYVHLLWPIQSPRTCNTLIMETGETFSYEFRPDSSGFTTSLNEKYFCDQYGVVAEVKFATPESSVKKSNRKVPNWKPFQSNKKLQYQAPKDILVKTTVANTPDKLIEATIARARRKRDIRAVAIFTGGTGVYDRHGMIGALDAGYHHLLDGLARSGIATIRYDKFDRQAASLADAEGDLDHEALCRDQRYWLDWAAEQSWSRDLPVILIGHSYGGVIALENAAGLANVAAVVTLNTPGKSLRDITAEQSGWIGDALGLSVASQKEQARLRRELLKALALDEEWTEHNVAPELLPIKRLRKFFKSALDVDPSNLITGIKCPLIFVQGERDIQVPRENMGILADAAFGTGLKHVKFLEPELDHMLKRNPGEGIQIAKYQLDRRRRIPVKLIRKIARALEHVMEDI